MAPTAHEALTTTDCKAWSCTDIATANGYCADHQRKEPMPRLEDLIDQQITLGHKDPHAFPELLRRTLGQDLIEVITPYLDDFISEMSRQRLGQVRRRGIAKITTSDLGDPEILLRSMWVPAEKGNSAVITYKPIGDMTDDDFDARAAYLERMAEGIHISAQWCRNVADQMRAEGATTAKNLSALPPLPEVE